MSDSLAKMSLTAIGTNRQIMPLSEPGPLVLLCFAPSSKDQIEGIGRHIKEHTPKAILVAHLIDLSKVSKLFRKPAELTLEREYRKAVENLPSDSNAYDAVIMLPDWDGEATKSLGLNVSEVAAAIVFRNGRMIGKSQGSDLAQEALMLLQQDQEGEP